MHGKGKVLNYQGRCSRQTERHDSNVLILWPKRTTPDSLKYIFI